MKKIEKLRYIIRHHAGYYINGHYEKVSGIDHALKFPDEKEAAYFLREGHYAAKDPEIYEIVPMRITYELEEDKPNGREGA